MQPTTYIQSASISSSAVTRNSGFPAVCFFIEHAFIKEKIRENKYWQENIQKTVRQMFQVFTLVSSILSSMPTYHLTVFPLAAWAKKKIDKIRRSFL